MYHLTVRVAWHDNRWNGTVCRKPKDNIYCLELKRIREARDSEKTEQEESVKGQRWCELCEKWQGGEGIDLKKNQDKVMPPCIAESGGFMNEEKWVRVFEHPYKDISAVEETHGHLKLTSAEVLPYSTFVAPFQWMLGEKKRQRKIDDALPKPLPSDEKPPFKTAWVFSPERQEALTELFFDKRLEEKDSLVLFYCKSHPLDEKIARLVVGVGRLERIHKLRFYEAEEDKPSYPMWDRLIEHSIRPEGINGFLLPYHDYLESTGDPEEDERRLKLLEEIAVAAESERAIQVFSYGSELADSDIVLSVLQRCMDSIKLIKEHGISKGPWDKREEWLNEQIARCWIDRGPFPGIGAALEAFGLRLGTSLILDLRRKGALKPEDNPWPLVDAILKGDKKPPSQEYEGDLEAIRAKWVGVPQECRDLIEMLSRFSLTPGQARRWFDKGKRYDITQRDIKDSDLLRNPYLICENDLYDEDDAAINLDVIDRGLLPDSNVVGDTDYPESYSIRSHMDWRRIRAALVDVLKQRAAEGDSLLSVSEASARLEELNLSRPCEIDEYWPAANRQNLEGVIECIDALVDSEKDTHIPSLQLTSLKDQEDFLSNILQARAASKLEPLDVDWEKLLLGAIQETGGDFDSGNERHQRALKEQKEALSRITRRKLTVLTGQAGTGKTSVLGALARCEKLKKGGILFLAPTGKARVRLGNVTGTEPETVAQFLYRHERYDTTHQRPLLTGQASYSRAETVVIDECSMLTMDLLVALLEALDLVRVKRIMLVGDPNQLPPIGVGRPFTDFVGYLRKARDSEDTAIQDISQVLTELTVELRSKEGEVSDSLRLAGLFTSGSQPVNSDLLLNELESGKQLNDLEVCFWKTPEDLYDKIIEQFEKHLDLEGLDDIVGFNRALGINEKQFVPFESPDGAENFQILSPIRKHLRKYGTNDINRWVQSKFRNKELIGAREGYRRGSEDREYIQRKIRLGDEEIVIRDKVIQVRNKYRTDAYNNNTGETGLSRSLLKLDSGP